MPDTSPNQAAQNELVQYLSKLPPDRRDELLDFARFLALQGAPQPSPRETWRSVAGILPDEDAKELSSIVADGCEQIDAENW